MADMEVAVEIIIMMAVAVAVIPVVEVTEVADRRPLIRQAVAAVLTTTVLTRMIKLQ